MTKIEFEGTDGAGKTTGLKYFIERAKKRKLNVVETREVGNPNIPICVKLREIVLSPDSELSGEAMELIFSAMRMENDRWLKNLQKDEKTAPDLVVSDRGWFSHLAYTDFNVSTTFTQRLYGNLMGLITEMPNVVIYFKVNTDTALKRRVKRGTGMDVIEMKGVEYQEQVRGAFEEYLIKAKRYSPEVRIFEVDANQDVKGVQKQLDQILDQLYSTEETNSLTP
jgi:dTMP kinase